MKREKIVILGGGVGAMTAAFELTESPDWQDKYDITVYQLGWRLGGKGASGRNQNAADRIEEHGLHLWFGYYENAFNIMQRCYSALGRKPGEPLATWQDAFHKHSLFVLCQYSDTSWSEWHVSPPVIGKDVPGDGKIPPFWEILDRLLAALHGHLDEHLPEELKIVMRGWANFPHWMHGLMEHVGLAQHLKDSAMAEIHTARELIQGSANTAHGSSEMQAAHLSAVEALGHFLERLKDIIQSQLALAVESLVGVEQTINRLVALTELGYYFLKGIVADDVANKGFDQLDHLDLREWLAGHGAPAIAINSDALRVAYESIFAYENGSYARPNLAAGTGLRGLLRLCFTFKGAFAYKMQAGMGDTVFTPLYQVLKQRGVTFNFFARVESLLPSADGSQIEAIQIARQATVKNGSYDPLYDVKGLPCWPSMPLYDQLVEGDRLKQDSINLESNWVNWEDVGHQTLKQGEDFDQIVMGISLGAVPNICAKMMKQKPAWQAMTDNVDTIKTQAFQIWTKKNTDQLRTPPDGKAKHLSEAPVYGGFAQPHNTCADMSHLIIRENWPEKDTPKGIYYFCGPLIESTMQPLNVDYAYPEEQSRAVNVCATQWLRANAQFLFPGAISAGYPGGFTDTFDFGILSGVKEVGWPINDDFNLQFWRANIDPSERYVLSTKGSSQYRLRASDSGYSNLKLAGDWTFTALNYGCVEAATMSGMEAARAICGYPKVIFGENFPKS